MSVSSFLSIVPSARSVLAMLPMSIMIPSAVSTSLAFRSIFSTSSLLFPFDTFFIVSSISFLCFGNCSVIFCICSFSSLLIVPSMIAICVIPAVSACANIFCDSSIIFCFSFVPTFILSFISFLYVSSHPSHL